MAAQSIAGKYFKFALYLVVVVLVNIAGITLFFRIDLTANKLYSLAAASKKVAADLSEPLTIKIFFTRDLPPPHNNTERYLHDLLEEYAVYAGKLFNYRFSIIRSVLSFSRFSYCSIGAQAGRALN